MLRLEERNGSWQVFYNTVLVSGCGMSGTQGEGYRFFINFQRTQFLKNSATFFSDYVKNFYGLKNL